jgi:hypothetical protein
VTAHPSGERAAGACTVDYADSGDEPRALDPGKRPFSVSSHFGIVAPTWPEARNSGLLRGNLLNSRKTSWNKLPRENHAADLGGRAAAAFLGHP